jgi:hypothetical protein
VEADEKAQAEQQAAINAKAQDRLAHLVSCDGQLEVPKN